MPGNMPDSSINKTSTSAFTASSTNPTNSTNPFQVGAESTPAAVDIAKKKQDKEQQEDRKEGQAVLDKVTEPSDDGYEERIEEEYAKREGGA